MEEISTPDTLPKVQESIKHKDGSRPFIIIESGQFSNSRDDVA